MMFNVYGCCTIIREDALSCLFSIESTVQQYNMCTWESARVSLCPGTRGPQDAWRTSWAPSAPGCCPAATADCSAGNPPGKYLQNVRKIFDRVEFKPCYLAAGAGLARHAAEHLLYLLLAGLGCLIVPAPLQPATNQRSVLSLCGPITAQYYCTCCPSWPRPPPARPRSSSRAPGTCAARLR